MAANSAVQRTFPVTTIVVSILSMIFGAISASPIVYSTWKTTRRVPPPIAVYEAPAEVPIEPAAPQLIRVTPPVRTLVPPSRIPYAEEARSAILEPNYLDTQVRKLRCRKKDCFVISDQENEAESSRLDLYAWSGGRVTSRIQTQYPVWEAEYVKFSPFFEEAIVASYPHGNGAYLELHVLLWQGDELVDLTKGALLERGGQGAYEFTDLDGDSLQELIVSWGKYERMTETFRFDADALAYLPVNDH